MILNRKSKNYIKNASLCKTCLNEDRYNELIFGVVSILLFLSLFLASDLFAAEQLDLSIQSDTPRLGSKSAESSKKKELGRIRDLGGLILIDGGAQVTQKLQVNKGLNLVGTSTPTTPSSNHTELFLNNTTKRLCAVFDDATSNCFGAGTTTTPGGSDTYLQYNNGGAFGGESALTWNYTTDLLTITSPNSDGLSVLSGSSGNYATLTAGRTASEIRLAIAAGAHQFAVGAVAGDGTVRVDDSTKGLYVGVGGSPVVKISSDNVVVSSSMTATYTITASSFSGNGVGLTALNASNIASGSLSDARLSSNVPLLASTNVFTGGNTFNSSTTFNGAVIISTSISAGGVGTSGQVLTSGGPGAVVSWTTAGGVTAGSTTTWTGTNVFSGSTSIKGNAVGGDAAAGDKGEYQETVVVSSALAASGSFGDVGTLALTAGNYLLSGMCYLSGVGAGGFTVTQLAITNTPGNNTTNMTLGKNRTVEDYTATTTLEQCPVIPAYKFSVAVSTTVYLKAAATYASGSPTCNGFIGALRIN